MAMVIEARERRHGTQEAQRQENERRTHRECLAALHQVVRGR